MKIGKNEMRLLFSWILYASGLLVYFLTDGEGRYGLGLHIWLFIFPIALFTETRWYIKEGRKDSGNG